MPHGRPTRTLRLPEDLLDRLLAETGDPKAVPALIEARCYPDDRVPVEMPPPVSQRIPLGPLGTSRPQPTPLPLVLADELVNLCTCAKPDLTGYGVCRTCHLRRR